MTTRPACSVGGAASAKARDANSTASADAGAPGVVAGDGDGARVLSQPKNRDVIGRLRARASSSEALHSAASWPRQP